MLFWHLNSQIRFKNKCAGVHPDYDKELVCERTYGKQISRIWLKCDFLFMSREYSSMGTTAFEIEESRKEAFGNSPPSPSGSKCAVLKRIFRRFATVHTGSRTSVGRGDPGPLPSAAKLGLQLATTLPRSFTEGTRRCMNVCVCVWASAPVLA